MDNKVFDFVLIYSGYLVTTVWCICFNVMIPVMVYMNWNIICDTIYDMTWCITWFICYDLYDIFYDTVYTIYFMVRHTYDFMIRYDRIGWYKICIFCTAGSFIKSYMSPNITIVFHQTTIQFGREIQHACNDKKYVTTFIENSWSGETI